MAARAEGRQRKPLVHGGRELHCTSALEQEAAAAGYRHVAGVDEVGCGALCGPVVACAVILGDADPSGLDDSKRLTRLARERLALRLEQQVASWALGVVEAAEIDTLNILRATHLAMRRALAGLARAADFVLVDGRDVPDLPCPYRAVVKGDALSVSIAAASIMAKVHRDGVMRALDERFPGYDLARNVGYGSLVHREALQRLGPCELHRRSFEVVRQTRLF
jgi:ribonuclease HII